VIRRAFALAPNASELGRPWQLGALFFAVTALALLRMVPARLEFEEPFAFWDIVPTMGPIEYLFEPWAGYLGVFARFSFLLAYQFDELGPLVTRLLAAAVIGLVAVYLASDELADAIPRRTVRTAVALSLPILPIGYPGPYVGPLNSQWWIAIAVLGIALARPRRWHYAALLGAGFVGVAPCIALPAFRDRRIVALGVGVAAQAATLLMSERRSPGFTISPDYIAVMLTVGAVMLLAPLPGRTRIAFAYLSISILALGAILTGWPLELNLRLLAIPGTTIALGIFALLLQRDDPSHEDRDGRTSGSPDAAEGSPWDSPRAERASD
jgi:hypothetical protein